ncbi:succinylglutamate desuccinylase/aspartoacylase family protein [Duganella dendranthematis]|jgi:predicted deacylase|uniref:Succinylglutamate desuccinylase/aspartoacylase family protein n=1 Tax=Duganella dendranthematis TaxID=2728021 RepID=A0ABX6M6C7_9BURK|nr:succinylglutamate desuccinylase/aspartoacylase family protein [Duganella dendranthematis]QJD89864.1 succinylglutamate desuccinylase/aspartoacylase family protein [Duganella dendranthematis]
MHAHKHPLSAPYASTAYELTSFHFGTPGSGKKVYIQGSLHADEVPGMLVAQVLRKELAALEAAGQISGEVILVPAANPIGLAQAIHGAAFGRFDLTTGVNFNRAYKHVADDLKTSLAGKLGADAGANVALIREHARASIAAWQPKTDAETLKKTLMSLAIDADIVLDLHCDNEAVLHIYAGTPLAEAIAPLSAILGSHATLLAYEAGGEPFDEACSRLWWDLDRHFQHQFPIPAACLSTTVELRGEQEVSYELANKDAAGLLQFLTLQGVLRADDVVAQAAAAMLPAPLCEATPLEGVEPLYAPHAGILVYTRELGARVAAGDAIADLIDPVSGDTTVLRAAVDGVFFARSAHRHVIRGMNVGKVAGAKAYRDGDLLSA